MRWRRRRARGFDLAVGAAAAGAALCAGRERGGRAEHVLLLLLHHIAGDGWSLAPLWRDVARFYAARRRRALRRAACGACRCSTPTTRCGSARCWAMRATGRARCRGSCRTGRERLRVCRSSSICRRDRPRPAVASHRGDAVAVSLPAALHGGLLELARECQASLFMVLQAGLAALLSRLGAGSDIAIGSPIAGRTDEALDDLVGFFVNTLVLRTDTSGQSELPRADRPGALGQPCGLQPPGCSVRASGRGAQPGAVAVASPAVPGDAGVPEQRGGRA